MRTYLKFFVMLALVVALPVQAVVFNLSLDSMIVSQEVTLASALPAPEDSGSDDYKIELANTTLDMAPLMMYKEEFNNFDVSFLSLYDLKIYNDLQNQLDIAMTPKVFAIDEVSFENSLDLYRSDRVREIKQIHAGDIASEHDELGALDSGMKDFSLTLRKQLEAKAVLMEQEQAQVALNLQLSLANFKQYYLVKKEEDSSLRSSSLIDSPVVSGMENTMEKTSLAFKSVTEKQTDFLASAPITGNDDSLNAIYVEQITTQVSNDLDVFAPMFDSLNEQQLKIVSLSNDIKLLSSPIVGTTGSFDDLLVMEEQDTLLAEKEFELQGELNTYYQMQLETQSLLSASLVSLNTFSLN
jgi:hypothetical protein